MVEANLALMCVTAFGAVFLLLTLLAVVMELITRAAPAQAQAKVPPARHTATGIPEGAQPAAASSATPGQATHDPGRIAAIASVYRQLLPGMKIVHLEEVR